MRNEKLMDIQLTIGFILVAMMSGIFGTFYVENQMLEFILCLIRLLVTVIGAGMVGKGLESVKGRKKSLYDYILNCE